MKWVGAILAVIIAYVFLSPQGVYASAVSGIRIIEIKLGGPVDGQPTQFIELFNDSDSQMDLGGYRLEYAKPATQVLASNCTETTLWGVLDTTSAVRTVVLSGSIAPRGRTLMEISLNDNSDGSVRLSHELASSIVVDDLVGWGATAVCSETAAAQMPENTKSIKRFFSTDGHPVDTDNNEVDFDSPSSPLPEQDPLISVDTPVDELDPVVCNNTVVVNEFLTDPVGLEADGGEFIELYNPSDAAANLLGCSLHSSKSTAHIIDFDASSIIAPHGYFVVNSVDTLTNTNGSVTFVTSSREDIVEYSNVKEGDAMAMFENGWEITNVPTPSTLNIHAAEDLADSSQNSPTVSTLAPCPAGKYRNPDTNRCRTLLLTTSSLETCDEGQYRSPETNRCRKVTTATAALQSCDIGQERNPDTNRCRKISTTSSKTCEAGYERNPDTNRCRKVVAQSASANFASQSDKPQSMQLTGWFVSSALVFAGGYAAYEYRAEIGRAARWVATHSTRGKPPDL